MELKKYQKNVIKDLLYYLELLNETGNLNTAYYMFWGNKNVPVGFNGLPPYQNIFPGVPNLCFKVPTGGGKTFLACNAVKPIFDALPVMKAKVVVWLVPSDTILDQTITALRDPEHPYRQKIDIDFGSRVEIYTKQELLNGQNFNIAAVSEQLSIMVLSYDSFRGRKEILKAKQENSNLASMAKALGAPINPIEETDETALLQIINQLSPLVIVDESHHARSILSKDMLKSFNPCFILDLTATPSKESNVIAFVDAIQLKRENMVKLPVIVYNRDSQQEVMADAIDLRNRLEQQSMEEQANGGPYIRPIVLFQAQSKGKESNTTYEQLRNKLVDAGISSNEIAIKTAEVNELKNTDLLSHECPIRYIITVNALKEGWDCPFAYILASLANKTSKIDVEQILGRILRQPYTRRHEHSALNMSYVLTSSNDFKTTLDNIVQGLNGAGFSGRDCRVLQTDQSVTTQAEILEQTFEYKNHQKFLSDIYIRENADDFNFDKSILNKELEVAKNDIEQSNMNSRVGTMLDTAKREHEVYENSIYATGEELPVISLPIEIQNKINQFHMNDEFIEEAKKIKIPQFFMRVPVISLFSSNNIALLQKEHLIENFTLKGKPYPIDFNRADDEIARVDINDTDDSTPKVFKMSESDQRFFKEQFTRFTPEQKARTCKDIIFRYLNKMDGIESKELLSYIDVIVSHMDLDQIPALEKSPHGFAIKIKQYIEALIDKHSIGQFSDWLETGKIICSPSYELPETIAPLQSTSTLGRSLYQAEEEVNGFEYEMVMAMTAMPNIKWWHRNISRQGFFINGFVNHYPDFIVMTKSKKVILIETKGDHLENTETKRKLELGRAWQNAAGAFYKYFLVFQSKDLSIEGAIQFNKFIELLKEM